MAMPAAALWGSQQAGCSGATPFPSLHIVLHASSFPRPSSCPTRKLPAGQPYGGGGVFVGVLCGALFIQWMQERMASCKDIKVWGGGVGRGQAYWVMLIAPGVSNPGAGLLTGRVCLSLRSLSGHPATQQLAPDTPSPPTPHPPPRSSRT